MSLFYQYDPNFCQKTTYNKKECLQILEILLFLRDQKDTFGNRLLQFGVCFLRLFSKNLFSQKLEIPVPPREWIVRTIGILDAAKGEDLSNTLHNSDAYRKLLREVSNLSLEEPYWGKLFDGFGFISFLVERRALSHL